MVVLPITYVKEKKQEGLSPYKQKGDPKVAFAMWIR